MSRTSDEQRALDTLRNAIMVEKNARGLALPDGIAACEKSTNESLEAAWAAYCNHKRRVHGGESISVCAGCGMQHQWCSCSVTGSVLAP